MTIHERLTIVIAACNEQDALPLLHPRIRAELDALPAIDACILYVDDGSSDDTWALMQQLAADDPQVAALRLSRTSARKWH